LQARQEVDVAPVVEKAGDVRPAGNEHRHTEFGDELTFCVPPIRYEQVDVPSGGEVGADVVVAKDDIRSQ
jgi:hypothetical protein